MARLWGMVPHKNSSVSARASRVHGRTSHKVILAITKEYCFSSKLQGLVYSVAVLFARFVCASMGKRKPEPAGGTAKAQRGRGGAGRGQGRKTTQAKLPGVDAASAPKRTQQDLGALLGMCSGSDKKAAQL